eukprot:9684828-Alexandrium_andersonii.AAC.1
MGWEVIPLRTRGGSRRQASLLRQRQGACRMHIGASIFHSCQRFPASADLCTHSVLGIRCRL